MNDVTSKHGKSGTELVVNKTHIRLSALLGRDMINSFMFKSGRNALSEIRHVMADRKWCLFTFLEVEFLING